MGGVRYKRKNVACIITLERFAIRVIRLTDTLLQINVLNA
jgi:hypothetical protein